MEQMLIGSYIRQKREDKGLTLRQLCDGICTVSTLSRIESNGQAPSIGIVKALLERLGLPAGKFFALLSESEIDADRLRKKIHSNRIRLRRAVDPERRAIREEILADLETLEELGGEDNRFVRQFVLSVRATVGGTEGPFDPEMRLDLLMRAIRLTVPRFDLKEIAGFQYRTEEIIIVNQIARVYASTGDRKKAIGISSQLLRYIEKNNQDLEHYPRQFCLVAHNYAIDLGLEKQYEKAIPLAEKGRKICAERGDYEFLPGFLAILAECLYFTGNYAQSAKLYFQAYYLYQALEDADNCATMRREMNERLGLQPPC